MRWDARGTIALLVSALVGVTAGVIVGISSGSPGASTADPGGPTQSSSQPASPTATDPLGIGAPLVNLDCTGQKILVVGSGETTGALTNAVSANPGADVKYLETEHSCNTLYGAEKQDPPAYVVYLGPFDTISEPCSLRMSIDHKNDVVTNLKPNVKIHVQCLCVLDPATFPELAVGMRPTTQDGIYIRALQTAAGRHRAEPATPHHRRLRRRDGQDGQAAPAAQRDPGLPAGTRRGVDLADAPRPGLRQLRLLTP